MKIEYDATLSSFQHIRKMLEGDIAGSPFKEKTRMAMKACFQRVEYILKEYVEPWTCPHCQWTVKVPPDGAEKKLCPKCKNNDVLPYSYKEQARMSAQLHILMQMAEWYSHKDRDTNKDMTRDVAIAAIQALPAAAQHKS